MDTGIYGIYRYDIKRNSWEMFLEYPEECDGADPIDHRGCIDQESGKMYLFGGDGNIFVIIDLENKAIDCKCVGKVRAAKMNFIVGDDEPTGLCTSSKLFVHGKSHLTYIDLADINGDDFKFNTLECKKRLHLIYVESLHQILSFGTRYFRNRDIFCINVDEDEQEMRSRKYEIQLPFDHYGHEYFAILSYQYILFVILKTVQKVYCLDLLEQK